MEKEIKNLSEKISIKEFTKKILGIKLTKFQEEILMTKGRISFYPLRKYRYMWDKMETDIDYFIRKKEEMYKAINEKEEKEIAKLLEII